MNIENKKPTNAIVGKYELLINDSIPHNIININILENLCCNCARTGKRWYMKSYKWSDLVIKLTRVIRTNADSVALRFSM